MKLGTLVIVDMQPVFSASKDYNLIKNIRKYIRLAKIMRAGIVVVEYEPWDYNQEATDFQTDFRILKLLKGYENYTICRKGIDDGSKQVIDSCRQNGYDLKSIFVTGINTCACVARTVEGLSGKLKKSKIQVIKSACHCNHCDGTEWQKFPTGANIVVH